MIYDPQKYTLFRLDGHKFSKITMDKPFDKKFNEIMKYCLENLLKQFNLDIGYTGSDQITVCYYPKTDLLYKGRKQKLDSLFSGYVSALFSMKWGQIQYFDCRSWQVDTKEQVIKQFNNRRGMVIGNSRMQFIQQYTNYKERHLKKGPALLEQIKLKFGVEYYDQVEEYNRIGIGMTKNQSKDIKELMNELFVTQKQETQQEKV